MDLLRSQKAQLALLGVAALTLLAALGSISAETAASSIAGIVVAAILGRAYEQRGKP